MSQSYQEQERIIGRYSNRLEYPEDYAPVCKCRELAKYEIGNKYYCESCIWDIAEEVLPFEGGYCEYCGEDITDAEECIKINGDIYHFSCFESHYEI